jgi:DNA-binding response OmpR family regulator
VEQVLLVAADDGLRDAFAGMLRAAGFVVHAEPGAEAAMRAAAVMRFHAVVLVCPLPGQDATASVASLTGVARLIAVVHTRTEELAAALRAAGADEVVEFVGIADLPTAVARASG